MKTTAPLPWLPYLLLIGMTVVSFAGPFAILLAVRGGESANWPPDRPVEWVVIGAVLALFLAFFTACVSIRAWYRPVSGNIPAERPSD
ncbi:hypothetical protein [Aquisphaera insulae]|uniref:hypothetical protein n=1 Tax=Aquisphaera insulae TaxID=2712864 RepID=UPI0013EDC624|nr:hypothetical protein [Aquisphaera insulae]